MSDNLPTLLKSGMLVSHMGETDLDNEIPINYIINYIKSVYEKKDNLTESDRFIILLAKTGAGKSTILPVELFKKFNEKILMTQPRVITTIEIVKDIANRKENNISLFKDIGYQTQEYKHKADNRKNILVSTLGVLLQFLKNIEPNIFVKKFKFILIDEVHDKSIDRDLTLFYIKRLVKSVPIKDLPIFIFMSATLDIKSLSKYFNTKSIIEVKGKTYPIQENYIDSININKTIIDLLNNKIDGDTIIFLSSMHVIDKLKEDIYNNCSDEFKKSSVVIKLDSKTYNKVGTEYKKLMTNYTDKKKIILTTNVAETGLTLPDLKYCIDSGYYTMVAHIPYNDMTLIINNHIIDKSMKTQRMGRVGRTKPGIFYGLYSKEKYNNFKKSNLSEIYKNRLDNFVLNVLSMNEDTEKDKEKIFISELINPPSNISIKCSNNKLFTLGFIKENDKLTLLGKIAKKLYKLNIEYVKLLSCGFYYNVNINDLIIIISLLQNRIKTSYNGFNCDFLNSLYVYKLIINETDKSEKQLLYKNFSINKDSFKKCVEDKYNLMQECLFGLNINIYANSTSNTEDIKKCIYEAFKLNILTYKNDGYYNRFNNKIKVMTKLNIENKKYIITDNITNNKVGFITFLDNNLNSDFNLDETFLIS